ncbi:hypothetical protein BGP_1131 [Beggiatoa sp. PS]|nr:hypothetical protein BGP_1131 [Beggiatoa sp. PS]
MKTVDDRLTQRLAEVEDEQNRLDELLEIAHKKTRVHKKKTPQSQQTAFGILTLNQKWYANQIYLVIRKAMSFV